jgi:hypothetical protein
MVKRLKEDLPWLQEAGEFKGYVRSIRKRWDQFKGPYLRFEFIVITGKGKFRVMGTQTDVSWKGWNPKKVTDTQFTIGNWEGNWPANQWLRTLGVRRIEASIVLDKLIPKKRIVTVETRNDGKHIKVFNITPISKTPHINSQIFTFRANSKTNPSIPPNQ